LFAKEEFIEASRKFVCVRLESFESKKHQDMVREYLNGRFANTAFCILSPDGKKRLSGAGRSPSQGFGLGRSAPDGQNPAILTSMEKVAADYPAKGPNSQAVIQDFHSFKQALNIASGDQRLFVFVVAQKNERERLKKSMQQVANHPDTIGRYHYDFADQVDAQWSAAIEGDQKKTGIFIIQAGKFGQDGQVVAELPLDTMPEKIRAVLEKENEQFAKTEQRKDYSAHVSEGRREGVKYEDNMPWGEDRDGDGKIDERRHRARPRH
jgi:hypothetical protein